ncbi:MULTISPECIES: alpha-ketoglutarate-dependent dioxygenase AlkB family protein [Lysobacteraceae]|nr:MULTISPECIES: alpha-ketoglutarate-dependent dioxygenase AlkB [Lysobacter]
MNSSSATFASDLFSPAERVLIEDEEGGCRYVPAFIDVDRADAWFAALRDEVDWRQQRRPMYDRVVEVPRLTSGYALNGSEALPAVLGEAHARVCAELGVAFTHVGLNYYRDGHDSVAPHNDKLSTLIAGEPIALVSLGSARRMEIRAKAPPRGVVRIDLEPGSLLVMSYAMQSHYDHGIPKTKHAVGPRISLAFRVRPSKVA